MANIVPLEMVESKILLIRGEKVMLDRDLAVLYGVETKMLIRAVKRNSERFPTDFMFRLNQGEFDILRSHFGTSSDKIRESSPSSRSQFVTSSWGGRRYLPYVFTEQGVAMLSGVLKSRKAVTVNIAIMRTFVKMRKFINSYEGLARKIAEMEKEYDQKIIEIFRILDLFADKKKKVNEIGFRVK